jgi:hypothetical protein
MKQTISLLALGHVMAMVSSFSPLHQVPSSKNCALSMVSRFEYLRPQFHVSSSPSSTTPTTTPTPTTIGSADNESCGLEEMSQLLQDLEQLSSECLEYTVEQDSTREWHMDELGYQMERSSHMAEEEHHEHQIDLTQHLRRMHEIAEYEEH